MLTFRGFSKKSMDPADKSQRVECEIHCQQTLAHPWFGLFFRSGKTQENSAQRAMPRPFGRAPFFILSAFLFFASYSWSTTPQEAEGEKIITQLYHNLAGKQMSLQEKMAFISATLLNKPYLLGALGEGDTGDFDQWPLYRMDQFDCETLVDTVLAFALADNLDQFKQRIKEIRYKNGIVSFITRNHFTDLDWNKNNQQQGFLKDITRTILDEHQQPVYTIASAYIDKKNWYAHLPLETIRIPNLSMAKRQERLKLLKQKGMKEGGQISQIAYLPLNKLFDRSGKANNTLFKQIPQGAIIEIIRPNWDLEASTGTHLNVSHMGLAFWQDGILIFREASSIEHKVIDIPLVNYLSQALTSPTIKGINVQIQRNVLEITPD